MDTIIPIKSHSIITKDISIEKVSEKLFFIENAPTKPMVAASYFYDEHYSENYIYQVDIALYLPKKIKNIKLKEWEQNQYISPCMDSNPKHNIDTCFREITIDLQSFNQSKLAKLLQTQFLEFNLYVIRFKYTLPLKDTAESIFVNYTYGDPETTRGTVTTVREIKEKKKDD